MTSWHHLEQSQSQTSGCFCPTAADLCWPTSAAGWASDTCASKYRAFIAGYDFSIPLYDDKTRNLKPALQPQACKGAPTVGCFQSRKIKRDLQTKARDPSSRENLWLFLRLHRHLVDRRALAQSAVPELNWILSESELLGKSILTCNTVKSFKKPAL